MINVPLCLIKAITIPCLPPLATVSDRASTGVYEDLGGPAILGFFAEAIESKWDAVYQVIPDEQAQIEAAVIDMVCHIGYLC